MTHPFVQDYFKKQEQTIWLKFIMHEANNYLSKTELSEKSSIKIETVRKYIDRLTEQQQLLEIIETINNEKIKKYMLNTNARTEFGKQVALIEQEAFNRERTQKEEMDTTTLTQKFHDFISKEHYAELIENVRKGHYALEINFKKLAEYDPDLADATLDKPIDVLQIIETAALQFDLTNTPEFLDVLIKNIPQSQNMNIAQFRQKSVNKLVMIRGRIINKTFPYARVQEVRFECPSCGNSITVKQQDLYFAEPKRCSCGRKGKFRVLHQDFIDEQRLVIEELPENLLVASQLATINVQLQHTLTDAKKEEKNISGSRVEIIGILKASPKEINRRLTTQLDYVLEAKYIKVLDDRTPEEISFTEEDLQHIQELSQKNNPVKELLSSTFPNIYGHDVAKQLILLQQFSGGSHNPFIDEERTRRLDFHILLVGDPGTAKTHLARCIKKIAPNTRLASGTGITGVGLTGALRKDDFTQNWFLQAGLLPLCHEGTAIIDEFEKANEEDIDRLHEAMENQEIHIDKSHVHAKLMSQVKILATANPAGDKFEPNGRNFTEQIPLRKTIQDRFDFIIPFKDMVEKKRDEAIAHQVLKQTTEPKKEAYSPIFILKYILYAKRFNPIITDDIRDIAVNFYVGLRDASTSIGFEGKKPTPRILWSIIRLSIAIARCRLKDAVSKEDLRQAIELHDLMNTSESCAHPPMLESSEVV